MWKELLLPSLPPVHKHTTAYLTILQTSRMFRMIIYRMNIWFLASEAGKKTRLPWSSNWIFILYVSFEASTHLDVPSEDLAMLSTFGHLLIQCLVGTHFWLCLRQFAIFKHIKYTSKRRSAFAANFLHFYCRIADTVRVVQSCLFLLYKEDQLDQFVNAERA